MSSPLFRETERIEMEHGQYGRIRNVEVKREGGREIYEYTVAVFDKESKQCVTVLQWDEHSLVRVLAAKPKRYGKRRRA